MKSCRVRLRGGGPSIEAQGKHCAPPQPRRLTNGERRDPLGGLNLVEADFAWATSRIKEIAGTHTKRTLTPFSLLISFVISDQEWSQPCYFGYLLTAIRNLYLQIR